MSFLVRNGWYFLLAAIIGEVAVPFILGIFVKDYSHKTMAISSLGSVNSPVRFPFNLWMLMAGILLLLSTPAIYQAYQAISKPLTIVIIIFIAVFAIGACIFTCFFSVNETKETVTTASRIHGAGSAIGFMLLLFVPLLLAILSFRTGDITRGIVSIVSFVLALIFFVLFVMADKPAFLNTAVRFEGLWQRLNLYFMYLPLGYIAIQHMIRG